MTRMVEFEDGYWVSENGNIWTVWMLHSGNRKRRQAEWRRLKPIPDSQGYLSVKVNRVNLKIHRIVLEAFVGPCPDGMECRHLDGNFSNNRLGNLCWGTKLENWQDKIRHGRDNVGHNFGERNGNSRLTVNDVLEIRRLYRLGVGPRKLAAQFGVNRNHIRHIAIGKKWGHIGRCDGG